MRTYRSNTKTGLIKRAKQQIADIEQEIKYKNPNKSEKKIIKDASEIMKYSYGPER